VLQLGASGKDFLIGIVVRTADGGWRVGQSEHRLADRLLPLGVEGFFVGVLAAEGAGIRILVENRVGRQVGELMNELQRVGDGAALFSRRVGTPVDLLFEFGLAAGQRLGGVAQVLAGALLGVGQLNDLAPGGGEGRAGGEVEAPQAFAAIDDGRQGRVDAPGEADRGCSGQGREGGQCPGNILQVGRGEVVGAGKTANPPALLAQLQRDEAGQPVFAGVVERKGFTAFAAAFKPAGVAVGQKAGIAVCQRFKQRIAGCRWARQADDLAAIREQYAAAGLANRVVPAELREGGEGDVEGKDARLAVGAGPAGEHAEAAVAGGGQALGRRPDDEVVATGRLPRGVEPGARRGVGVSGIGGVAGLRAGACPALHGLLTTVLQGELPAVGVGEVDGCDGRVAVDEWCEQGPEAVCIVELEAPGEARQYCSQRVSNSIASARLWAQVAAEDQHAVVGEQAGVAALQRGHGGVGQGLGAEGGVGARSARWCRRSARSCSGRAGCRGAGRRARWRRAHGRAARRRLPERRRRCRGGAPFGRGRARALPAAVHGHQGTMSPAVQSFGGHPARGDQEAPGRSARWRCRRCRR
jgi:hypothetical protein